jgi:GT2 family glycosyltransferase
MRDPISVLILSWNRPLYLWACLDSLYRYTRCPAQFLLVDNHSEDPLVATVVTGFQRRGMLNIVEWGETNSPTRTADSIRKYSSMFGDYFIYIESDVVVFETDPCWLSRLCDLMDSNPNLGILGSYIDTRDFIDPDATKVERSIPAEKYSALAKAASPERSLPEVPPDITIVEPFNPPGRLLAIRTELLPLLSPFRDDLLYLRTKEAGFEAGIATGVRHRHLSLLNYFDYPQYDTVARNRFFGLSG